MKKKFSMVLFSYLLLYIVNFLLIPFFFHALGRTHFMGLMDSQISLIVTFVLILLCMWKLTDHLLSWIVGTMFYLLLMLLYIPKGVYGIGIKGIFVSVYDPEAVPFGILIVMIATSVELIAGWAVVKLIKKEGKMMKKILFFLPACLFLLLYAAIAILDRLGAIHPAAWILIAVLFISGQLMLKHKWYGCLGGIAAGCFFMYLSTRDTGQIIQAELPVGVILCLYYLICGAVVYKSSISRGGKS